MQWAVAVPHIPYLEQSGLTVDMVDIQSDNNPYFPINKTRILICDLSGREILVCMRS